MAKAATLFMERVERTLAKEPDFAKARKEFTP
jgi:hypothetical protein